MIIFANLILTQQIFMFNILGDGITDNTHSTRHTFFRAANYNLTNIVLIRAENFVTPSV